MSMALAQKKSLMSMELDMWCNPVMSNLQSRVKSGYEKMLFLNALACTESKMTRWRVLLWKRIKKERKRFVFQYCSSSNPVLVRAPYDPYTYSQNFDQGATWTDPDVLSRSFSARFAAPSRVFHQKTAIVD